MSRKQSAQPAAALLDTTDFANRLKTRPDAESPSERTIERWRTNGTGPKFIKVGRRVFYRESAIERWLDQQTRSHTNQNNK